MLGWIKHKLESKLLGELWITSDMQITPPLWQKWRRTKKPLDESERGEWKSCLKPNIQKTKIMASGPITPWEIDGETVETLSNFILGGSKITAVGDCSHEIKKTLTPWKGSYAQPKQHIKKQRHYFANRGPSGQSYGFSSSHVWMWESWAIKKAELQIIDPFKLWCWSRLLRFPWTARKSNWSVRMEINSEYSLEGLFLSWSSNTLSTWYEKSAH